LTVFCGSKKSNQTDRIAEKSLFWVNLISLFFHALCPADLSAFCIMPLLFATHSPPSPLYVVHHPILCAINVRRLHRLPLLLSAVVVVILCRRRCPPPPSSAAASVIATPCLLHLLPPALVHPLCSLPPNLACRCCPLLSLSPYAILIRRRRLPPPQPSSPIRCLRRLFPPALVLPHCTLPNHVCCCCPPPSSSATVVLRHRRTSTCPPSNKMLIVAL
jgi:hypothetical protein